MRKRNYLCDGIHYSRIFHFKESCFDVCEVWTHINLSFRTKREREMAFDITLSVIPFCSSEYSRDGGRAPTVCCLGSGIDCRLQCQHCTF